MVYHSSSSSLVTVSHLHWLLCELSKQPHRNRNVLFWHFRKLDPVRLTTKTSHFIFNLESFPNIHKFAYQNLEWVTVESIAHWKKLHPTNMHFYNSLKTCSLRVFKSSIIHTELGNFTTHRHFIYLTGFYLIISGY